MRLVLGNLSTGIRDHFTALAADPANGLRLIPSSLGKFASSEPFAELFFKTPPENIHGQPVTIIHSVSAPVSEHTMQLLLAVRTLKGYGAGSITVAMPFAPFARQDRPFEGRMCSVAGYDFPFFLKAAGAERIITSEVHSKAAEQFYVDQFGSENVTFLSSTELFKNDLDSRPDLDCLNTVIGAPDGADKPGDAGQRRAHDLAHAFQLATYFTPEEEAQFVFHMVKKHTGVNTTVVTMLDDNVRGKTAVIVDDMTDSGGTIINAAKELKLKGASSVTAYLTHGLMDDNALLRILSAGFNASDMPAVDRVVLTDTVPGQKERIASSRSDVKYRTSVLPVASQYAREILKLSR